MRTFEYSLSARKQESTQTGPMSQNRTLDKSQFNRDRFSDTPLCPGH